MQVDVYKKGRDGKGGRGNQRRKCKDARTTGMCIGIERMEHGDREGGHGDRDRVHGDREGGHGDIEGGHGNRGWGMGIERMGIGIEDGAFGG